MNTILSPYFPSFVLPALAGFVSGMCLGGLFHAVPWLAD